ncbi:MAG: LTA synthase family protein [Bacteroidales bacterium]
MRLRLDFRSSILPLVFYRIFLALAFISLTRLMLYFFQKPLFNFPDFPGLKSIWLSGLRFDLSAVFMLNLPYLAWALFPFPIRNSGPWQKTGNFLYYAANIAGILLNMVDTAYYPFNLKRLTADIFSFLGANNNIFILIPQLLYDFVLNLLVFLLIVIMFIVLIKRVKHGKELFYRSTVHFVFWNLLIWMFMIAGAVIFIRGGWQRRPITLINASEKVQPQFSALVLNTPFTIIKTWKKEGLPEKHYFTSEDQATKIFNPVQTYYRPDRPVKKDNIVIIILESFGSEHSAYLNEGLYPPPSRGYTPFLDSLMKTGLTFRAYANGKRSIEGIPAVVAGIPHLLPIEFINSPYASNDIESLPAILKNHGYQSVFYHGGINGTMHFDAFASKAGFDAYKGMNEYEGPPAFDGQWGIFDEPYLRYVAREMDHLKEPFLVTIFTLSSHHPYQVPDSLKNQLPAGPLKIQQSIAYADHALRRFFQTIRNKTWFPHTLFILTADHTSEGYHPFYKTLAGQFSIPLIFLKPGDSLPPARQTLAQQIDILPSVCQYLNLYDTIISFGKSVFAPQKPAFAINYLNGIYNLFTDGRLLLFDGDKTTGWYDLRADSLQLKLNKNRDIKLEADEMLVKSIIQQFNHRMRTNHLKH